MYVFAVKHILQKFDDVLSNSVLSYETFGPGYEFIRIEGRLFNWEGKHEAKSGIGWVVIVVIE